MNKIYLNGRIAYREDTLSDWEAENPVLERGEPAIIRDGIGGRWLKIGDGETAFKDLPYKIVGGGDSASSVLISPDGTSVVMGDLENSFAGTKAFRIISGNSAEKSYILDSVEGLEGFEAWPEEDRYLSFYVVAPDGNSSHRNDNTIRLVGVDAANNKIYTSSFYAGWPVSGFGEGSYLRVIARPELGTFWAELYAFAAGCNNRALGDGAFAVGANNLSNGAYSFAAGRNNTVQYCSFAFGRFNEVPAQLSVALGQYNQLRGHNSIGLGCGLKTTEVNQIAVGRYNLPDSSMLFMLGNGTDDNSRNNLFGLDKSGNAYINGQRVKKSIGVRVYALPDVGEADKIYCLRSSEGLGSYIFLETEHTVGTPWDGTIAKGYAGGAGTEADPYIIETPEQFARMIDTFGEGGKYYCITNDVYLNDVSAADWYANEENKPWFEAVNNTDKYQYISRSGIADTFSGNIDGGGHIIYGLWYPDDTAFWGGGLIPTILNGTVKNLGIGKSRVVATLNAGAFSGATGRGENGTVIFDNCFTDGDVYVKASTVSGAASGFVGYVTVGINTTFTNCYCLATSIIANEGYKANAFVGQTWNSPYRILNCFSVIRPFNSYNLKARLSSLVIWEYQVGENRPTVDRPVEYAHVYSNIYTLDASALYDNEYGFLNGEPIFTQRTDITGSDALTALEKMPGLGEAFTATEWYPELKVFIGEWVKLGGAEI